MILALLGAALVTVLHAIRHTWIVVTVHGESMQPTLQPGQRLVARRRAGVACARGDVIVFAHPARSGDPRHRIKRVAAVAGEPVPPWLGSELTRVPTGQIVIVGDNPRSEDSRHLGLIDVRSVLAVVRMRTAPSAIH
jgi:signal peptidase I